MKKNILMGCMVAISVSLIACERAKETPETTPQEVQSKINKTDKNQVEPKTQELPAVWAKSYSMDVVNAEICQNETEEEIAACTLYDVQSIKTNVDWINQYYDNELKKLYADTAFGKKSNVKLEGEGEDRKYYEGSIISFEGQNYNLVTFSLFNNSYSGGAHNNFNTEYTVFDLTNKKKLTLNDVLKPVAKAKVLELLKSNNQSDLTEYQTDLAALELSENFYFGQSGLVFVYAPYEIAPWVFGMPELSVPYSELKDLIKPEYMPNQPDYRISQEFS